MSAAPDLKTLFYYEQHIETAWQTILRAADPALNPQIQFSDGERDYPMTSVRLTGIKPLDHQKIYLGRKWDDAFTAQLISTVETVRGKNSAQQAPLLGAIRVAGQQWRTLFTEALLPYYQVVTLDEANVDRGVDPDTRLDNTIVTHTLKWMIRDNAWPVVAAS